MKILNQRLNKTIFLLMLSDLFVGIGFGLIDPILAIFFKESLIGGTIFTAGLASAIFLTTKSIVQLPFSKYIDSHKKKLHWLIAGTFIVSLVPIIYLFSTHMWHIFIAQFILGIGSGLAYPTWLGIWSTHLDKHHESFEWSLYSTLLSLGIAITAATGAALAQFVGFRATFLFVSALSLTGMLILFGLENKRHRKTHPFHDHAKRKLVHRRHY